MTTQTLKSFSNERAKKLVQNDIKEITQEISDVCEFIQEKKEGEM